MKGVFISAGGGGFGGLKSEVMDLSEALKRFRFVRFTSSKGPKREELWNKPEFEGWLGPMWSGDPEVMRYESRAAYEVLST